MKNNQNIPVRLMLEHFDMYKTLAQVAVQTAKLKIFKTPQSEQHSPDWKDIPAVDKVIAAPKNDLVDAYIHWSGASIEKYRTTLPAHMVSQWGLSIASDLVLQSVYPLANVINQGLSLHIYGELPRDTPLKIHANIESIQEIEGIARIAVKITTGTEKQPHLVDTIVHMAFLLPNFKKSKSNKSIQTLEWKTVGHWRASAHDGLKFAMLTGDFNPIHWIKLVGMLSPFKNKVLHGFGMLVRSYECLPDEIKYLDVRFTKPVNLPSAKLSVQIASQDNQVQFRLLGAQDQVHMIGHYE
ncbi:protein dehydratase [Acinetobacter sp. 194]|uniref:MaoC/PaaZ C-terminal domain-containing protein n=1 Tax=Acinetobacter shaoyimingii TaxID=2715164 RepID=UPI00140D5F31|nr:MaoC/PaaZ C-terminal domain-containing protein [Acinetobacter shaoyimingii]NHB57168.1 protein dehydratase [Acinetobacter shaoyimingii]